MKGIVFNLLEEIVAAEYGEDVWDDLLDDAALDGSYTSLGNYADEDLMRLVAAASERLELPAEDVVRWFGRNATPLFKRQYPNFFAPHDSTLPFVLTLNEIIHPEVRKLYPGADVPVFDFDTSYDDVLVMGYSSSRKLCAFAEGLLLGAGDVFGEEVTINQPTCMNRGDERCRLEISVT
ncbi:MAG: heme NO-binding domain-containing protein [Solirubrobacterales bacterium]